MIKLFKIILVCGLFLATVGCVQKNPTDYGYLLNKTLVTKNYFYLCQKINGEYFAVNIEKEYYPNAFQDARYPNLTAYQRDSKKYPYWGENRLVGLIAPGTKIKILQVTYTNLWATSYTLADVSILSGPFKGVKIARDRVIFYAFSR